MEKRLLNRCLVLACLCNRQLLKCDRIFTCLCCFFQSEIASLYDNYRKQNDAKNLFSAGRTPAVLFTMMFSFYVAASILGLIGLESLANLANLAMFIFLFLLLTWFYVRYSGEHRQIGTTIDQLADMLWENVSILLELFYVLMYYWFEFD